MQYALVRLFKHVKRGMIPKWDDEDIVITKHGRPHMIRSAVSELGFPMESNTCNTSSTPRSPASVMHVEW